MTMTNLFFKSFLIVYCCVYFSGASFSQEDSSACEWTTFYYSDGEISSEGCLQKDVPVGQWSAFYTSGTLKSQGERRNGEPVGKWKFFWSNGNIQREVIFDRGIKHGMETVYDSLGRAMEQLPWLENVKQGEGITFFPDQSIKRITPYVLDEPHGAGREFASDGRLITRLDYHRGYLRGSEAVNRFDGELRKRGIWVVFHENGRVAEEGSYSADLRHGYFRFYRSSGDLDRIEQYEWGVMIEDAEMTMVLDIRKSYHENGSIKSVGGYKEGVKHGVFREYDEDEALTGGAEYTNGHQTATGLTLPSGDRDGQWKLYYDDGSVKARGDYMEGKRNGAWMFFSETGELVQQGNYRSGRFHGDWTWYYSEGEVHRKEQYNQGREDGSFIELTVSGDTITSGMYTDGLKQGAWVYHVNDHREEGAFVDGEKQGDWKQTYENQQLRQEGSYILGLPDGRLSKWYPSGGRMVLGAYEGGVKHGRWTYYSEDQETNHTQHYKNGVLERVNGQRLKHKNLVSK
jgi:uncharacterized protein